ncbi:hypothetical protein F5888DRAFT_1632923 [Russula emetica]|nr:hypothetical protein F5888DRAFT_1632923 [Russula emetica]
MLAYDVLEIFPLHPDLSVWALLCTIQSQIVQRNDWLKEDMAKQRATRSPYSAGRQRKAECPHVYTRSRQECREVHLSASECSDVHPEYICANWRLGTSCLAHPQTGAAYADIFVSLMVGYSGWVRVYEWFAAFDVTFCALNILSLDVEIYHFHENLNSLKVA